MKPRWRTKVERKHCAHHLAGNVREQAGETEQDHRRADADLFTGFLVTVLVLESSLRSAAAPVYTQVRQVELDRLDNLASATLIPALIAAAILVVSAARNRRRVLWPALALVLLLSVVATTLVFNVPINTDQLTWNVQAPRRTGRACATAGSSPMPYGPSRPCSRSDA